jgi:catecholate siderophore receptor
VRLSAYRDLTTRKNLLSQTDLIWENRLGGIDQTLLLGFELGRQTGNNQRLNGVFAATGTSPTFLDVPITERRSTCRRCASCRTAPTTT